MLPIQFFSNRLVLNLVSNKDSLFMKTIVNSKGWLTFIGNRNIHTNEDALAYIHKLNTTPDLFYWVITVKQSSTPIGIVSFMLRNYLKHFDIGFALLPEYEKRGYAFEAVSTVLNFVQTLPQHKIVLATTLPDNTNSQKLLTKLGLQYAYPITREETNLLVYSINK